MWILAFILAVPVIEIALFVTLGAHIGVIATLSEVALTALLGVTLMRLEPHRNADSVRAALQQDQSPASPMAHSALRMIGAVLIFLPGFFTDALGLLLMIAPLRHMILSQMVLHVLHSRGHPPPRDDVIEGEFTHQPRNDSQPSLQPGRDNSAGMPPRRGPENRD